MPRPSPLQNRCAPDGSLHAVAARGMFMGNRGGRLHRDDKTLGPARWKGRAWICCLTAFRGRRRDVMGPGYTEIFFLDEATALAAGHRPCFECRRADALAFAAAWGRAKGGRPPRAGAMDLVLHAERLAPPEAATFSATSARRDLRGGRRGVSAHRKRPPPLEFRRLWRGIAGHEPDDILVALTPPSIRAALGAGYVPRLHPSATA